MLALGLVTPAPAAAAGIEVVFDGRASVVDEAELAASADVPALPYTIRSDDGSTRTETRGGVSIRTVIALAGGDPDTTSGVSVERPGGGEVTLAGPDLADPSPFPEGPALVWVQDGAAGFLRPVRDEADVNAPDLITGPAGGNLTVTVQSGALLEVLAGADDEKVKPGRRVRFWASASGVDPGERLTYRWHFDDGTEAEGENVRHAFRKPGRYRVYVTVSRGGRSGGASPVITITVGDPDAAAKRTPAREQDDTPAGGTGAAAGGTGAAAAGGTGAAGGGTGAARPAQRAQAPARRRQPRRKRSEPAAPAGKRVSGVLIDPAPAAAPAPPAAARAAARSTGSSTGGGGGGAVPGEALGALLAGMLLGSGFLLERLPSRWRAAR